MNNECEVFISSTSIVYPNLEDASMIPSHFFHFKTIHDLKTLPVDSIVDIISLMISTSPTSTIHCWDGFEMHRKTLTIKDMSGYTIDYILWGQQCDNEGKK